VPTCALAERFVEEKYSASFETFVFFDVFSKQLVEKKHGAEKDVFFP